MLNKKMLTLPMLLVIGLSFTGYAFASWIDTLSVSGTLTTAALNLTFSYVSNPDELASDPLDATTATVTPKGALTGDVDTITLTINDAFPGYKVKVSVDVKNVGTIPAKFCGFQLDSNPVGYNSVTGWTDTKAGIIFTAHDSLGEILYPGGVSHSYTLELEVTNDVESGTTTTFTIGVVFEQGV
jgi:hypothetical protein